MSSQLLVIHLPNQDFHHLMYFLSSFHGLELALGNMLADYPRKSFIHPLSHLLRLNFLIKSLMVRAFGAQGRI